MSLSVREVVGKLVKKTITRGKREVEVKMLVDDEGQEMLIRRDTDSILTDDAIIALLDQRVKALGALDGSVFIISQIEPL